MTAPSHAPRAPASCDDAAVLTRLGHEIRTPLNAIVGLSHLCMQTRLDEHQRQYLSKILAAANELLHVCQSLPAAEAPTGAVEPTHGLALAPYAEAAQPVATSATSRVLLVEDNEINQEIAAELLKVAGVEVDMASNGQEALDAVNRAPYALIFMDVQMPVMDGLEATRRLRAQGCTTPIIAMTAHATSNDADASLAAGMNAHLTKPLEPEALFATLNRWMPMMRPETGRSEALGQRVKVRLPDTIEGFNLDAGLAAVGNNAALYASLLQKFALRHATIAGDICDSLQKNDLPSAMRLAHTVKGIAANLGATSLADAADTLEKTLINDPGMAAPHLTLLVTRLNAAVAAVNNALVRNEVQEERANSCVYAPFTLTPQEAAALGDEVVRTVASMETDWTAAYSTSLRANDTLAGTACDNAAHALLSAVEDFATQSAQECAGALQAALLSASAPA